MNCREAQRLLHLDRPGERTDAETQALRTHLAGCRACASEAVLAGSVEALEQRLRTASAPVPQLSDVRAGVLAAVSQIRPQRSSMASTARLAYAFALTAVAMWFGFDQWSMQSAHVALLERSSRPTAAASGPQIVYSVDASTARTLASGSTPLPAFEGTGSTIVVPQATAREWLEDAPAYLVRTLSRRPAEREQLFEALRLLRSAVDVSIRYRPKGA